MGEPLKPAAGGPLAQMLEARERRWQRRLRLSEGCCSLLTLTLCIPLPFRTEEAWKCFLRKQMAQLEGFLEHSGLVCGEREELDGADGLALFACFDAPAEILKTLCVRFEEEAPRGRLLDADVMEAGRPIGRAELRLPPRRCFLCARPAAECVSVGRHAPEEVAALLRSLQPEAD